MSKDNLSHSFKFSARMGKLYPLGCWEVVPGDRWRGRCVTDIQFRAMVAPIMHNIMATVHYWFVPWRLAWEDFPDFFTGGKNGDFTAVWPYFVSDGTNNGPKSLAHYLANAGRGASGLEINALPIRSYNLICNEWYRNQNVTNEIPISTASGLDTTTSMSFQRRTWKPNDVFTNSLPFTQRGNMVSLPVSGDVPVYTGDDVNNYFSGNPLKWRKSDGSDLGAAYNQSINTDFVGASTFGHSNPVSADLPDIVPGNLRGSLQNAGTFVDVFRTGVTLQHVMETLARGGARMVEALLSLYGVRSEDARLQRPEFLGGGSRPIMVSKVLQTSATDSTSPQANPAGFAQSLAISPKFEKRFTEFGYIIPILSIMPQADYFQGLDRMYTRKTRWDLPYKEMARIGDQAILKRELYADGSSKDTEVFGYGIRYYEFHRKYNRIAGDLCGDMDYYTLARKFNNHPELSQEFCECIPDEDRIFAVTDENVDNIVVDTYHELKLNSVLPKVIRPGLSYV